jgi:hypothetical protein
MEKRKHLPESEFMFGKKEASGKCKRCLGNINKI